MTNPLELVLGQPPRAKGHLSVTVKWRCFETVWQRNLGGSEEKKRREFGPSEEKEEDDEEEKEEDDEENEEVGKNVHFSA